MSCLDLGPAPGGVGEHAGDVVLAQQVGPSVAKVVLGTPARAAPAGRLVEARTPSTGRSCRLPGPPRGLRGSWSKNVGEPVRVVLEGLGELPQDRPELGPELQDAGVEELLERLLDVGSRFMWVMNRLPLTANTKSSGVWSRHLRYDSGFCRA